MAAYPRVQHNDAFIRLAALALAVCSLASCSRPVPSGIYEGKVDPLKPPLQKEASKTKPILFKVKGGEFIITPVAFYSVAAVVASKEGYWFDGWRTKLAPYDFALCWGALAEKENKKFVSFRQSGRWYYFNWRDDSPFTGAFVFEHSSNNHLIPANKNILAALKSIKKGAIVKFEGYLVNVDGTIGGANYWWHSSTSRTDTGDASCEVFYVEKVIIDGREYL